MSLKEDIEMMERYSRAGLLKEFMHGTAPILPPEPWPADKSATTSPDNQHRWLAARGE